MQLAVVGRSRRSLSLPHPVALSFRGDDGCVVSGSIEKRGSELFVAGEDRDPFGKWQICRDDDASPLVALREELAAAAIEGHESYLVDDEQLDVLKASMETRELALVARLEKRADEIGSTREEDASSPAGGLDSKRDREVRFSSTDRASKDEILGP